MTYQNWMQQKNGKLKKSRKLNIIDIKLIMIDIDLFLCVSICTSRRKKHYYIVHFVRLCP